VRSIDSALLSAEDQDLADTEDTDSSTRGPRRRRYRGPAGHVTGSRLHDEQRVTSSSAAAAARHANAVSAARHISSINNLHQVCVAQISSTTCGR